MTPEQLEISALNREIGELQGALTFILAAYGSHLHTNTIESIGGLIKKINQRKCFLTINEQLK